MKILKIYDDLPWVYTRCKMPQKFQEALGDEWTVEFYQLKGRRMRMCYPSEKDTDGTDNFDIEKDQVYIFWNLIWSYYEELNADFRKKYLEIIKKGAKIKITTYSANADISYMVEKNQAFIETFGTDIVSEWSESIMYVDYINSELVKLLAKKFKKAFD